MGRPSVREVDATLTAAGSPFELIEVEVGGRVVRQWASTPRTVIDVLERGCSLAGVRPFLIFGDERLSHDEHFEQVTRLAARFVDEFGVRPGDRVAIAARNLPEWSVAFWAAAMAGGVAVALNAFWNGAELAFALEDCEPRVLVADGERFERLIGHESAIDGVVLVGTRLDDRKTETPLPAGIVALSSLVAEPAERPMVDIAPDDLVSILYTSGTTSHPKGVMGTHRNMCANVVSLDFVMARGLLRAGVDPFVVRPPASTVLLPVPLFHGTGLHSNLVAQAWQGGTVVLMRKWDPEVALDLIEREGITGMGAVPTMNWDLVNSPSFASRDLSSLRSLGGGGAASPPELVRRIKASLPSVGVGTGYGMTESSSVTSSIGGADYVDRPTSVGVPVPVCSVRLVGDDGNDVLAGEAGEIWMSGVTIVPGYWRRPEANEQAFGGGWLRSGDLGRIDADGFLYIVDRAKDMVIRGGENISSLEVEAVLFDHPDVLEAAVFAVPHPALVEEVGAVVRLREGSSLTAEQVKLHAGERLAPFKVPAHIWFTTEPFPRGATGKIQKRELKAPYLTA